MKNLTDFIQENLQQKLIKEALHGVKPADEKLFWKWVKDLGEVGTKYDITNVISKNEDDFYKKVADLGTTPEQFETFCDVFFTIANQFGELIEDDDAGDNFGSDDSVEYATWAAPFYGEKDVTKALKDKDYSLCDSWGEEVGYAMDRDTYEEYLEDNELEPKGYK